MIKLSAMANSSTTYLHDLLEVDPTSPSGLRWKVSTGRWRKGNPAGGQNSQGYWRVQINRKSHRIHRLVLELSGRPCPGPGFIPDHRDSNPSNNALENLRWVLQPQNDRRSRKTRGKYPKYVMRENSVKESYRYKFRVENSRQLTVGGFTTPAKAHTAALAHRLELFWNP